MAETAIVTLRHAKGCTRRIRQSIKKTVIVLRAVTSQLVIIGVTVFPFRRRIYRGEREGGRDLVWRESHR